MHLVERRMKAVTVVGGGFSGLATAYYLSLAGIPVEMVEKTDRLGGLIATLQTPHGPVETAAVGMRNSARVDAVCRDLGLEMLCTTPSLSRAGYIYRWRPRRWPLSAGESIALVARFVTATARGSRSPRPLETVEHWGARVLGPRATQWLVGPALHGRYAGDPARLSASLLFGTPEWPAPRARKGVVAPVGGMQQLIDALERRLRTREVSIRLNTVPTLDGSTPVVICTSARAAAECLRHVAPAASQALSTIDMLPLVRMTAFYPGEPRPRWGRGILFPRGGGDIRALGVLFNTNIFPQRKGDTPRAGSMGALRIVTSWTFPTTICGRRWIETVSCSAVATSGPPHESCTAGAKPCRTTTCSSSRRARGASSCRRASSSWGTTWRASACRWSSSRPLPSPPK